MRILIVTPRLPWPPLDGGRVAMSRLAESLAACGAAVEVLSLNPRKHRGVAQGPVPVQAIDVDTSHVLAPAWRALTGDVPYVVARFVSREFADALDAAMKRFEPDVVQIESPFLLPYAPFGRARVVLRSVNVEFRIWEGLARTERNPLRRLAFSRIALSLRAYELREMNRVDAIVPISQADADDFRALGCIRPMHVVPCGVPLPELGEPVPGRVGFIGALDFRPNQQAVEWILDELAPRLPGVRIAIAGSAAPEWLRRAFGAPASSPAGRAPSRRPRRRGRRRASRRDGGGPQAEVELLTDIADPQAFVRGLSVFIAPLFAGGGMRIKVLEAMALAKPIVATAIGVGGIDSGDFLIAEDADSFAEAVMRLLEEPVFAKRLGAAARATVAERYDNQTLARGLLRFYESL